MAESSLNSPDTLANAPQATAVGTAAPVPATAPAPTAAPAPAPKSDITDAFWSVPAEAGLATPPSAKANLTWVGSGRSAHETIAYECEAAHLDVRADTGKLLGKMFSVSYTARAVEFAHTQDQNEVAAPVAAGNMRPVTFCYNGGPGCASVPINFGGMGPKRVKLNGIAHLGTPIEVEDNPYTLLRQSDLVFLDALGTGWSSVAADADPNKIFGIDGDADAFCRAISTWLEEHGRWMSPVYLFGESYGTVRNSVVMRLLGEKGIKVAGVTMLSAIFDWAQVEEGSDLYHLGMTPTYAAAAHYFGKVGAGETADQWFDRAVTFTDEVLAPALLMGDRLSPEKEQDVAWHYSELIGLAPEHIISKRLRITLDDFRRNILADEGKVCGRLDMRFATDAPLAVQESSDWFAGEDAADDAVEASWTCAFRQFLHDEVGYRSFAPYLSSNYEQVGTKWKWDHVEPGKSWASTSPNVAYDISVALKRNPTMKLAILGGRYDAATTYWNVIHDMSCQFLSPSLKAQVEWHRYGCGHMAYVDEPTALAMSADMEKFYAK